MQSHRGENKPINTVMIKVLLEIRIAEIHDITRALSLKCHFFS